VVMSRRGTSPVGEFPVLVGLVGEGCDGSMGRFRRSLATFGFGGTSEMLGPVEINCGGLR